MGLAAYFCRHLQQFAMTAIPPYQLIGEVVKFKNKQRIATGCLKEVHEQAFQAKRSLTSTSTLDYPIFTLPFIIEPDASAKGLIAILSQKQGEKTREHCIC